MIRDAVAADASGVAALLGELGYPSSEEQARARIERIGSRDDCRIRVFAEGDAILGLISMQLIHAIEHDVPVLHLTALVVASAARRRGVGRTLIDDAEAFARRSGCARINVGSGLRRADAHAFYESIGFTRSGVRFRRTVAG